MFKIHRRVEHALIALRYMSQKFPGQITSAKEICDKFHLPFDPASRVLQVLAHNNIIKAEQGPRGGYQIIYDLSKLSLQELSTMLTGPLEIAACLESKPRHCESRSVCEIMTTMHALNTRIGQFLYSISVAELITRRPESKKSPPDITV